MISKRNYGVDLLRIISMFFVLILHSLGHGGVLANVVAGSVQYKFAWAMEIFAYCAVDIFALISGYVSWNSGTKYEKYINLWLEVAFYCLLSVIIFLIYNPSIVGLRDIVRSLSPVTTGIYWYFTAYTGLFLFKPLLDKAIQSCDNLLLKKIFLLFIFGFSFFDIIVKKFSLQGGYSVIWLIILYICGAIINKCEIGKNIKWYCIAAGLLILYVLSYICHMYNVHNYYMVKEVFGITIDNYILTNYTSPTILGMAILYLMAFSRMKFHNLSIKLIAFCSSSAFAAYLLNEHYLIRDNFIGGLFYRIANKSCIELFLKIVGFSLVFLLLSIIIDKFRMLLFKILRINNISKYIAKFLRLIINGVTNIM